MNIKKFFSTMIIYFLFWLAYTSSLIYEDVVVGLVLSLFLSLFTYKSFSSSNSDKNLILRFINTVKYIPLFIIEMVKANIDVAHRVINPKLPINPGIVKVNTNLQSDYAKLFLANSITLTPGTLTMDVIEDDLYIHWIDVETKDENIQKNLISKKFEDSLEGIF
ncbi:MAG: Na+/H+ antiporter subunit E [Bacillota bacterium]